jgi:hypothetical protein
VQSIAANSVSFDAVIYEAIASDGFWQRDNILLTVQFSEINYDQASGIHTIEANYRNDPVLSNIAPEKIEAEIISKGATIVNHPTNKVQFAINRTTVFDIFKQDVKEKVDGVFSVRKFAIPEQYVQMAINAGGSLSITRQQFATNVRSRLDD